MLQNQSLRSSSSNSNLSSLHRRTPSPRYAPTKLSLSHTLNTCAHQVRGSEREVAAILGRREEEEADPQLMVSVYDVARNQKAFQQREEEEERAREEERLQREKERDYLAPFLGRLVGDTQELDREQMAAVAEVGGLFLECMPLCVPLLRWVGSF